MSVFVNIHVPKTGGTTLMDIIEKQRRYAQIVVINPPAPTEYSKKLAEAGLNAVNQFSYKELTDKEISVLKAIDSTQGDVMITGHFGFGVHQYIAEKAKYFAMLRNPADLLVSLYHEMFKSPDPFDRTLVAAFGDFKQFFRAVFNLQTTILLGKKSPYELGRDPEVVFKQVKEIIHEHFLILGVLERFDDSLLLMKKLLGWDDIRYTVKNRGLTRPPLDHLDPSDLEEIQKLNALDYLVYEYVAEALTVQLRDMKI